MEEIGKLELLKVERKKEVQNIQQNLKEISEENKEKDRMLENIQVEIEQKIREINELGHIYSNDSVNFKK